MIRILDTFGAALLAAVIADVYLPRPNWVHLITLVWATTLVIRMCLGFIAWLEKR